jgi:hypothetical protein
MDTCLRTVVGAYSEKEGVESRGERELCFVRVSGHHYDAQAHFPYLWMLCNLSVPQKRTRQRQHARASILFHAFIYEMHSGSRVR